MATLFNAPSPRGTNHAGLYLTKAGTLVDKHGRAWGKSQIKTMAMDAALAPPVSATNLSSGEVKKFSSADWAKSYARRAVTDAVARMCHQHNIGDEQHQKIARPH
jgi:hypothetical protein